MSEQTFNSGVGVFRGYKEMATPVFEPNWVLRLITKTQFRDFTKDDWACFNGCEDKHPLFGEFEAVEFEGVLYDGWIVVDGDQVNIGYAGCPYGGRLYYMADMDRKVK